MIPLSPIDHLFTGQGAYPIQFVFSYDARLDAEKMRESLEKTLQAFPPLRSQLRLIDDCSYALEESAQGYVFSVVERPEPPDLSDARNFDALLDRVDTFPGEPLMKIKLTQSKSSSFIGVSVSHCVVDGYSYFMFLSSWAMTYNKMPFPGPDHRRELLIPPKGEWITVPITPEQVIADGGAYWGERRPDLHKQKLSWTVLPFSRALMKDILGDVSRGSAVALSENDALCAYLWKGVANERSGPLSLSCAFDYRRVHSKLSPTFFGNAVRTVMLRETAEWLKIPSLAEVALKIRRAVWNVGEEGATSSLRLLESLRRQKGLKAMEELHVVEPHHGLLVTNLSRLPLKALDFGAGPPTGARIMTPGANIAVVVPARDGVEVHWAKTDNGGKP